MIWPYYFFIFLFGLCWGSFLNVCVYRINAGKSFMTGRSYCPHCAKRIAWYDNIPVLSFLVLRGQCRTCQGKISWQYPLVEFWTGFIFVFIAWFFSPFIVYWPLIIIYWFVVWILTFVFLYDLKFQEILDSTTMWPALVLFFVFLLFNYFHISIFPNLLSMLLGVLVGAGFFLLQYLISKGKWIGGGDIRLGVLMGVILGWPNILVALMLAYVLGAIVGVFLLLSKKKNLQDKIAFGTFLCLSTLIVMLWGDGIIGWYLGLLAF